MRKYIPSVVSFLSLSSGITAILFATRGNLIVSSILVLVSYLLDAVDGELARRLNAQLPFGLQLDSLVDGVVFGIASPFIIFQHIQDTHIPWWITGLCMLVFSMAGIFRLARFNLHAGKEKPRDTLGLTISTSGAYLALSVLTDLVFDSSPIPDWLFIFFLLILAGLMVSRIRFPEFKTIFRNRKSSLTLLASFIVMAVWLTPQLVWLLVTTGYITFGVGRAIYRFLG